MSCLFIDDYSVVRLKYLPLYIDLKMLGTFSNTSLVLTIQVYVNKLSYSEQVNDNALHSFQMCLQNEWFFSGYSSNRLAYLLYGSVISLSSLLSPSSNLEASLVETTGTFYMLQVCMHCSFS